ncbi:MAG TPA: hypothetical protein VFH77_09390, partial [Streptomyces sp.]|nr:hypothetical protein [Streptomyces sp.]
TPAGLYATDEVTASTLPVDLVTDTYRTMLRTVVPVDAGDLLDIAAWARVTNDTGRDRGDPGYTVGVGWHLWAYDVDTQAASSGEWWRIAPWCGDNVTRDRHHMPLAIDTVYRVPADWPAGHRIVVVLRADAHSTAAVDGDELTVDREYGHLTVRRWKEVC